MCVCVCTLFFKYRYIFKDTQTVNPRTLFILENSEPSYLPQFLDHSFAFYFFYLFRSDLHLEKVLKDLLLLTNSLFDYI